MYVMIVNIPSKACQSNKESKNQGDTAIPRRRFTKIREQLTLDVGNRKVAGLPSILSAKQTMSLHWRPIFCDLAHRIEQTIKEARLCHVSSEASKQNCHELCKKKTNNNKKTLLIIVNQNIQDSLQEPRSHFHLYKVSTPVRAQQSFDFTSQKIYYSISWS